jgi:hypothetical protein
MGAVTHALPWEAEIADACRRAEAWFQATAKFPNGPIVVRSVVGFEHPALLSEADCRLHFARFLVEAGVPWEAIHMELSNSIWMFDAPHPAASIPWRTDVAIVDPTRFSSAELPAVSTEGFRFDAFLEFKFFHDPFSASLVANDLRRDAMKVAADLATGAADAGYVIAFAERPWALRQVAAELSQQHPRVQVRVLLASDTGAAAG